MKDLYPKRCETCDKRSCVCLLNGQVKTWLTDLRKVKKLISETLKELEKKKKND